MLFEGKLSNYLTIGACNSSQSGVRVSTQLRYSNRMTVPVRVCSYALITGCLPSEAVNVSSYEVLHKDDIPVCAEQHVKGTPNISFGMTKRTLRSEDLGSQCRLRAKYGEQVTSVDMRPAHHLLV